MEEFSKKNERLEAELVKAEMRSDGIIRSCSDGNERVVVKITNVGESSLSESRVVELQVSVRGECSVLDLAIRLLQFLKTHSHLTLDSVAANTSSMLTRITLRIRIQVRILPS